MEPTEAINALEVAWRELIRLVWGDGWLEKSGADPTRLETKRSEEQKKRRGALVSDDLLDYTEFVQLGAILLNNWEDFSPALGKKKYIEVYIDRLNGLRNAPMHSRTLLPFERDLLSGIVGEIRNLVAIYRSQKGPDMQHYPVIDSVVDSYGNSSTTEKVKDTGLRLKIGEVVTFMCRATDPQGRPLQWTLRVLQSFGTDRTVAEKVVGNDVSIPWTVEPEDVGEDARVIIGLTSTGQFHRSGKSDDTRYFVYAVDPPS